MPDQSEATTEPQLKGVDIARVNLTHLNTVLKEAGIKVTAKTSIEERVQLLQAYELAQCPKDETLPEDQRKLGDCEICFGVSQLSRPACPFCGTSEEAPAADAPVQAPAPKSPKAAAAAAKGKAPKAPKAPKEEDVKAVVKAADGKINKKHVQEIEGLERRIKGLIADSFGGQWKVGRELQAVNESGAWKYRVDEEGKQLFKGFGDWVTQTFGISVQYARGLMAVSLAYTEKVVRDVGASKLAVILRLPPEERSQLVETAAETPLRDVTSSVRRLAPGGQRDALPSAGVRARPDTRQRNATRPARIKSTNEVTAVFALNRYELPMFARAKSAESGEPVRAKSINADPHAVLDLHNGVQILVQIVEDENGLSTVLEFKRQEATGTDESAAE